MRESKAAYENSSLLNFWDSAADGVYDRFVLGVDAPYDIRRLLAQEDRKVKEVIEAYLDDGNDVVFVEIGSGTGRCLSLLGKEILLDERYGKHLKHVVGVDFSKGMIEASAWNLIGSRKVGVSLVAQLKSRTGLSVRRIVDTLIERIQLLHADVTTTFLEVLGAKVVIGIMFGTLGNIPDAGAVISNVRSMLVNGGSVIATVFNSEATDIGFRAYTELIGRGFKSLAPLRWDPAASAFTSDSGFYSHWFSFQEFKTLVETGLETKAEIIPIASQAMLAMVTFRGEVGVERGLTKEGKGIVLNTLCPVCGKALGALPVSVINLTCKSCEHKYDVVVMHGFRVPSLI